jgi:hypothetical protein
LSGPSKKESSDRSTYAPITLTKEVRFMKKNEFEKLEKTLIKGLALCVIREAETNPELAPRRFDGKMNITLKIPKSLENMFASFFPEAGDPLLAPLDMTLEATNKFIDGICSMIFFEYGIKRYLIEKMNLKL